MGDLNNIQIEPNINSEALRRQTVANQRNAISNEEATTNRHHLCSYTDEEKIFLVRIDREERQKGRGFMERIKNRWNEQYPDKTGISKQNLTDNARRFKREIGDERNENNTLTDKANWTLEMKVDLIKIDKEERQKGRGFMKRIKEEWDKRYKNSPLTTQCLRDNAARFKMDKDLMNLIEVREGDTVEEDRPNNQRIENSSVERDAIIEEDNEGEASQRDIIAEETGRESMDENEDEETKEMRVIFLGNLQQLIPTTEANIEDRKRLQKIKVKVKRKELEKANLILDKHLGENDDICKLVDAVYAMAKTIEQKLGMKPEGKKGNKIKGKGNNRRIRKLEDKLKKLRQAVARISNEIYRRKTRRKATNKEKEILRMLKDKAGNKLTNDKELSSAKEKWLEELRYVKVKIERSKMKDAKIRDNNMFRDDQGRFYRSIDGVKERKGKVPEMKRFVDFWAGI